MLYPILYSNAHPNISNIDLYLYKNETYQCVFTVEKSTIIMNRDKTATFSQNLSFIVAKNRTCMLYLEAGCIMLNCWIFTQCTLFLRIVRNIKKWLNEHIDLTNTPREGILVHFSQPNPFLLNKIMFKLKIEQVDS